MAVLQCAQPLSSLVPVRCQQAMQQLRWIVGFSPSASALNPPGRSTLDRTALLSSLHLLMW
jgi:hypothetical protein